MMYVLNIYIHISSAMYACPSWQIPFIHGQVYGTVLLKGPGKYIECVNIFYIERGNCFEQITQQKGDLHKQVFPIHP